jgi:hypothetical protein
MRRPFRQSALPPRTKTPSKTDIAQVKERPVDRQPRILQYRIGDHCHRQALRETRNGLDVSVMKARNPHPTMPCTPSTLIRSR